MFMSSVPARRPAEALAAINQSERPVLIVPGLHNSAPGHWQQYWLTALDKALLVDQVDWDFPTLGDWVASVMQALREHPEAILIGHSLGCALIAHVAQLRGNRGIGGALLVAPADVNQRGLASHLLEGFSPLPLQRFTFPSIVVASTNDPYVRFDRAEEFARSWGSSLINLGAAGHINIAAGYGAWLEGLVILGDLLDEIG